MVIPPLRTAVTTAALRRATHLLVIGGGRLSMIDIPINDSPESVFIGRHGDADSSPSPERTPPITGLDSRISVDFPIPSAQSLRIRLP